MSEGERNRAVAGKDFEVGGYVLTGGGSVRMGRAKARLEISGEMQIVRAARLMKRVVGECAMVGTFEDFPARELEAEGATAIADRWPGAGPLGGMATALGEAGAEWSLILACDMPYVTREWLAELARRAIRSRADAVVAVGERGEEPLCAAYHRGIAAALGGMLERGERKVRAALREIRVERVEPEEWKAFDSAGRLFKNMNTPADYKEAQRWFAAHPRT